LAKELLLNLLVLAVVVTPLGLLGWAKGRVRWVRERHDVLSIAVWLLTLFAVYMWVLPRLGLAPNPRVFEHY